MSDPRPEVVVITGASAGVGRAVVREFARRGACLGLVARGGDRLEAARREAEELGGRAVILSADIAEPDTAERIARLTEEAFGPIDVWINNAMLSVYSRIDEMPEAEFKRVTDVTYLGVVYGTKAALRRMLLRGRGAIVQVGSALAYRSIPYQSAYCAAKAAIRGFTDSLRSELIEQESRVRVTMVQLPALNTPQFVWVRSRLAMKAKPPSPIYQPEVAARAIYWAAHANRREVYVGLTTAVGIKLNKLCPGFFDRYLVGRSFGDSQSLRDPDQPDNLETAAPGDWAAHGPFDSESRARSWQFEVSRRRTALSLVAAGAAGFLAAAWWKRQRAEPPPRRMAARGRVRSLAQT